MFTGQKKKLNTQLECIADAGDHEITVERTFYEDGQEVRTEIISFEVVRDEHGKAYALIGLPLLVAMSEEDWKVVAIDRISRKRKGTLGKLMDEYNRKYR